MTTPTPILVIENVATQQQYRFLLNKTRIRLPPGTYRAVSWPASRRRDYVLRGVVNNLEERNVDGVRQEEMIVRFRTPISKIFPFNIVEPNFLVLSKNRIRNTLVDLVLPNAARRRR